MVQADRQRHSNVQDADQDAHLVDVEVTATTNVTRLLAATRLAPTVYQQQSADVATDEHGENIRRQNRHHLEETPRLGQTQT